MVQVAVKKHPEWPELLALIKQIMTGYDRCQPDIAAGAIVDSLAGVMVDSLMEHYRLSPYVGQTPERRWNHHERVRRIIHEACPDIDPDKLTLQVEKIAAVILGSFDISRRRRT